MNRTLAALLVALVVITGCSTGPVVGSPAAASPSLASAPTPPLTPAATSPTATEAPATPEPTGPKHLPYAGPIAPGTYRMPRGSWAAVGYTFTMPDGWVSENGGQTLSKHPNEPDEVGVNVYVINDIYADPCGPNDLMSVGPTAGDLAKALTEQPGPEKSGLTDITLGGYPAERVRLTFPRDVDPASCDPPIGFQIWLDAPGGKYFVLLGDGVATVFAGDIHGERLVFTAQARSRSSAADIAEMEAIIASVQIEPERST
jgi:hypothetical protein